MTTLDGRPGVIEDTLTALSESLVCGLVEAFSEVALQVSEAYDGEPGRLVYGSPAEARAWVALREDGDGAHFLRVFGKAGEGALRADVVGAGMPTEEFVAEARKLDERRKTSEEIGRPLKG